MLRNSPRAKFLRERYPESRLLLVNKETDIYLELAAGRGDVGFGSSVVSAESFLKRPEGKGHAQLGLLRATLVERGKGHGSAGKDAHDHHHDDHFDQGEAACARPGDKPWQRWLSGQGHAHS